MKPEKAEKVTLRVHEGGIQARYANLGARPTPPGWHEYIWRKAVQCSKEGKGYVPRGLNSTAHVGWHSSSEAQVLWRNVHRITSKGALFISCGKVSLAEMNKIAKKLGWS